MRSLRRPRIQNIIAATVLAGTFAFAAVWFVARVCCSETVLESTASISGQSTTWVCETHPDRVSALIESLNLNAPGLEPVRDAVERSDMPGACDALLAYYRSSKNTIRLGRPVATTTGDADEAAELLLADEFHFYRMVQRVPRRENGGLDWTYNGPSNDREWGWEFNNLYHLGTLRAAYFKTGQDSYVDRISADVTDWVVSNPPPRRKSNTPQWRGLQASHRAGVWANIFFALQHVDALTPAARLLMLSSLPDHAHYLMLFHQEKGNIVANEMKGLATVGAMWPEFRDAVGWRRYAAEVMAREINYQVYPDGVQTELTSHYHRITTQHFDAFAGVMGEFGRRDADSLSSHIEQMWDYTARIMLPDGYGPMNNDSDRHAVRAHLQRAAAAYGRDDWLYIATNGREGTPPQTGSAVFPWAGQMVMRSGWDENAHWSFFDVGPWGTGHQHNDKLHLSVAAYGRDLLVDGGRYAYDAGPFREYFTGSRAHNVFLVDQAGQKPGPPLANAPLDSSQWRFTAEYDFARGSFEDGYKSIRGDAAHARSVLYVRDEFWVVLDHIETDRARDVTALWHFHPSCNVVLDGETVKSNDDERGNLRIVPAAGVAWDIEIVGGVEGNGVQGWYSDVYGQKQPAPTVMYETRVAGPTTFLWVLVPAYGEVPTVNAIVSASDEYKITAEVDVVGRASYRITIPLDEYDPEVTRIQ